MKARVIDKDFVYNCYVNMEKKMKLTSFKYGRGLPENIKDLEVEVLCEYPHGYENRTCVGIELPNGDQFIVGKEGLGMIEEKEVVLRYSRDWWKERLHLIQAFVEGKDIIFRGDVHTCATFSGPLDEYEIAPETHVVNGYRVPKSVLEPLCRMQNYYAVVVESPRLAVRSYWDDDETDMHRLKHGLVHLTREAAVANAKAMLNINPYS